MLLRLGLVWVIVLTSLSLGMARGQLRTGTEVILCSGSAVVMGLDGPHTGARYCPDMAQGLLAAYHPPPPAIAPPESRGQRVGMRGRPAPAPMPVPAQQARGPPSPRAA
ncbi:hypothetical protein H5394_15010 [Paracoccus sp. MC1862]|nr:hypothetical protein [Paracoccus sp. MC1862]